MNTRDPRNQSTLRYTVKNRNTVIKRREMEHYRIFTARWTTWSTVKNRQEKYSYIYLQIPSYLVNREKV
jgi:hypothetical protein